MINFIKNIFQEYKYWLKIETENNLFLWKKWEYFLVSEYNKSELKEFFESKKTNNLIEFFDKQKAQSSDIEKNTSLIILLKVENLENDFKDLKNQIMKIEEDEYFFRKYVIVYDEKSTKEIEKINNIEELNENLNEVNLEKFRENNYNNSKYFLIIQLFVKLPFLKVKTEELDLEDLLENINKKIEKEKLKDLNNFILSEDFLSKWESEEGFFDRLKKEILNPKSKDEDVINFLNTITK